MANDTCDCCEGTKRLTPASVANRPGLSALAYRVGTHARFLETMKARLSSLIVEVLDPADPAQSAPTYPLRGLTTRDSGDPAIALLDGWATVADVLTFYQERIANEGYLRTATERRSILELARLVGYALRPGVSASVFLAYTIDTNLKSPVELPIGTRSQSVPGPGEQPQSFETSEVLDARVAWNVLQPRLSQPQSFETIEKRLGQNQQGCTLYLKGISTNLKPSDPLLLVDPQQVDPEKSRRLVRINDVLPDPKNNRTLVTLKAVTTNQAGVPDGDKLLRVMKGLSIPASVPPANTLRLSRSVKDLFAIGADTGVQIVNALRPDFREALSTALANVPVTPANPLEVHAFRVKAGVYGSTAPLKSITDEKGREIGKQEWPIDGTQTVRVSLIRPFREATATMSVTNADGRLASRSPVKVKTGNEDGVGTVKFRFFNEAIDHTDIYRVIYNDTSKAGNNATLIYQINAEDSIDVTIVVDSQERKINITLGEIVITAIQSHNWKIAYFSPEGEDQVLSITDEAPLLPDPRQIALDGLYDQIAPDSWFVIQRPGHPDKDKQEIIAKLENKGRAGVQTVARTDYNFPAKVTELTLDQAWLDKSDLLLSDIRSTTVFAQSEKLELAGEPIKEPICGSGADQSAEIELDGLYTDLKSGRWLIVAGERADIKDANENIVDGLKSAEVGDACRRTIHGHRSDLSGDKTHTFITLARELAYCYQRDKVTIYGNVVKATHGETRNEVLGSGDGSKALQSFDLKQPPVTYVAAPNPSGVDSTLHVYVNDVEWHAADTLAGLAPTDHNFTTRTNDEGKPTVIFGNGQQGARLPTGMANVRAVYRNGLGKGGNVQAGQINLLLTRPLGVNAVVNPLRASGGADKESRDQARQNAPLAVMALDRLVSVQDYADFARTFAGIGKAAAVRLSDGRRELVHVTIAGADDIPIEPTSDLYRNLVAALRRNGDPYQPFQVALRELLLLVISANIRILPDYEWDKVVTRASDGLLDVFGFEQRDLGQDVRLNDITSIIQGVPGVAYVDVDLLATIPEMKADGSKRRLLTPDEITQQIKDVLAEREAEQAGPDIRKKHPRSRIAVGPAAPDDGGTLRPARLAILSRAVPDTLILNQIG